LVSNFENEQKSISIRIKSHYLLFKAICFYIISFVLDLKAKKKKIEAYDQVTLFIILNNTIFHRLVVDFGEKKSK
jgi:hypothetical protein